MAGGGINRFQFLMVRLKEVSADKAFVGVRNFNSLWCD